MRFAQKFPDINYYSESNFLFVVHFLCLLFSSYFFFIAKRIKNWDAPRKEYEVETKINIKNKFPDF